MTLKKLLSLILPKRDVASVTASFTRQFEEIEQMEAENLVRQDEKLAKLQKERDESQAELTKAKAAREWLTKGLTGTP